jgi:hypothetical protein
LVARQRLSGLSNMVREVTSADVMLSSWVGGMTGFVLRI